MINGISAALAGLNSASQKASQAANNIANVTTPGIGENVNLTEETVNLKIAELEFKANASTLRSELELSEELLRIFDEKV